MLELFGLRVISEGTSGRGGLALMLCSDRDVAKIVLSGRPLGR